MSASHVLVVDEEPQIVRGLAIILRGAGYAVEAVATNSEALARLAASPPDALVLDLGPADGQGVELCSEVRRSSRLPILVSCNPSRPRYLITEPGVGYRLRDPADVATFQRQHVDA